MASSTTQIPYDILISIIDVLALHNQWKDLSACSQTCRMLLRPCRIHLFSTIQFAEDATQFAASLNRNPTIPVYVRKLTYTPEFLSGEVAKALISFSNLETLVLKGLFDHGVGNRRLCYDWTTLTPDIQQALARLLSFPSLTHIAIYFFDDVPISLLSICSNLKHLDINLYTSFTSEICNTTLLAPPKLVSLDISKASMQTVEMLLNEKRADGLPLLDLSGLRSLIVRTKDDSLWKETLAQILRSTLKLEHICFKVGWCVSIPDSLVEALTLFSPTLRSLKIEIGERRILEEIPGLVQTLQTLSRHPNNLNEINIIIRSPWTCSVGFHGWEEIDQILADRTAFGRMEKIRIKFSGISSNKAEEKRMQDQLMEFRIAKLPRLSLASDDYLDFQVVPDDSANVYSESKWMIFSLGLERKFNLEAPRIV